VDLGVEIPIDLNGNLVSQRDIVGPGECELTAWLDRSGANHIAILLNNFNLNCGEAAVAQCELCDLATAGTALATR
jgi:hypothetical protein